MTFLVTGATGFVGRELCRELRRGGEELRALSRRGGEWAPGEPSRALDLGAAAVEADLLSGVEVVLHLGGIAHRRATPDEYRRVNLEATLALAASAAEAGASAFVYVSSVKAMGPPGDRPEAREEGDCRPPEDPYSRSKRDAELALEERFGSGPMSIVVVRPALVYGPGVGGNLAALIAAVRRGLPRPPARGGRSMISRADLVRLLLELGREPPPGFSTWIAVDGETYSTRRICDAIRAALGRAPAPAWLPAPLWRLGCACADRLRPGADGYYRILFGTELYSGAALRQHRGWRASQVFEDLAAEIVLRAEGT